MRWRVSPRGAGVTSGKLEARRAQRGSEPDPRQADEGGRVAAFDAFEQRDTERFGPEASCTIERPLALDVALDLRSAEFSKHHRSGIDMRQMHLAGATKQSTCAVEERGTSAECLELLARPCGIPGLIEEAVAAGGNLVSSDDGCLRTRLRPCTRFLERESHGSVGRGFAGSVRLAHARGARLERHCEPAEKLASIARGRSEDQRSHGTPGAM